ncbi:MAG: Gfo/Idh/MocA family oxidoreductase [Chloroflexi bacterium]|nr:Gfo/Idh/MocA family oxidoreductase [Chloroflexota bacterium]
MANKGVRIGVIGSGFASTVQIPALQHVPSAEIVAMVSQHLDRARACAKEFGIPRAYDDYQQMLAESKPDLVLITTPVYLHHAMTLAVLNAGCHVLCEKPMASNVDQAYEMLARATEANVVNVIDHELRFDPNHRRVKQLLDAGFVGKVYHVHMNVLDPLRADALASPFSWWSEASKGGGQLGARASHMIDLVQWWLGDIGSVSAQLGTWVQWRRGNTPSTMLPVTSDDQFTLLAETRNGSMVVLFDSEVSRHLACDHAEIIGSEGTLILDSRDGLHGGRTGEPLSDLTLANPDSQLPGIGPGMWASSFVGLAREVVGAVDENRRTAEAATFKEGLRVQQVLDAAHRSWSERRWVYLT